LSDAALSLADRLERDVPTVQLGPFQVSDTTKEETASRLVELAVGSARDRAVLAFALHVGGLNALNDDAFVRAMNAADLVYADGGSVVWLGKRNGASRMGRAATTDIGWDVLRGIGARLGRIPRVALIGGRPGLAKSAGAVLEDAGVAEPVLIVHGYHESWTDHVDRVRSARPDVVLVGMGAPNEMIWAHEWAPSFGQGLVLTCGDPSPGSGVDRPGRPAALAPGSPLRARSHDHGLALPSVVTIRLRRQLAVTTWFRGSSRWTHLRRARPPMASGPRSPSCCRRTSDPSRCARHWTRCCSRTTRAGWRSWSSSTTPRPT
jgi:N-acetylglucosaminyldiphosphoundecaprenol N-acetyl-beta-D-mannosaminyltransferase